jgi:hypothetical protein
VGVCPGPKICGPPPCHGPKPKPEHWHCPSQTSTTDYNGTEDSSSYEVASAEEEVSTTTTYSAEVSDRSSSSLEVTPTSVANLWVYLVAAAATTALIAGMVYRKRVSLNQWIER